MRIGEEDLEKEMQKSFAEFKGFRTASSEREERIMNSDPPALLRFCVRVPLPVFAHIFVLESGKFFSDSIQDGITEPVLQQRQMANGIGGKFRLVKKLTIGNAECSGNALDYFEGSRLASQFNLRHKWNRNSCFFCKKLLRPPEFLPEFADVASQNKKNICHFFIILLSATLENYPIAIYTIAYGNKERECHFDAVRSANR